MATFAYSRVSTHNQTTANQKLEIIKTGYTFNYWFADEGGSGKTPALQRPQFQLMLDKIRDSETLIVAKSIDWAAMSRTSALRLRCLLQKRSSLFYNWASLISHRQLAS